MICDGCHQRFCPEHMTLVGSCVPNDKKHLGPSEGEDIFLCPECVKEEGE
jgi:hypothetical protein